MVRCWPFRSLLTLIKEQGKNRSQQRSRANDESNIGGLGNPQSCIFCEEIKRSAEYASRHQPKLIFQIIGKQVFWRNRPNTYIGYQKAIKENFLRSESVINQYFRCNKGQPPDSNRQYGNQMIVSVRQFHTYTFNNAAKIHGIPFGSSPNNPDSWAPIGLK